MKKNPNYLKDILAIFMEHENKVFKWGSNDCISFACKCVDATYPDAHLYSNVEQAAYHNKTGANKVIKAHGKTIVDLINDYMEPIDVNLAQRGDMVLFSGEMGMTTGILWTDGVMSAGNYGAEIFNVVITHAWRVPKCLQQ